MQNARFPDVHLRTASLNMDMNCHNGSHVHASFYPKLHMHILGVGIGYCGSLVVRGRSILWSADTLTRDHLSGPAAQNTGQTFPFGLRIVAYDRNALVLDSRSPLRVWRDLMLALLRARVESEARDTSLAWSVTAPERVTAHMGEPSAGYRSPEG